MRLKNAEVMSAIPALKELVQLTLPVRVSFKVARLAREVEAAAKDIETTRSGILERYVERDEAGNPTPVLVDGEVQQGQVSLLRPGEFMAEMEDLLAIETEILAPPLRLEELGVGVSLSPATLLSLGPLLVDEPAAEVA